MDKSKETLPLEDLYPIIAEVLSAGREFTLYPGGTSMLPTIRPHEDAVVLAPPQDIKQGDILLYRRDSGVFVLHRVVKVKKDGSFVTRGDNQFYNETGVLPRHAVAVVVRYYKGDRAVVRGSAEERRITRRLQRRYAAKRVASALARRARRLFGGKK